MPKRQRLRGADIHRLSIFKTVVESGGLSQAAELLNVDLSTISRQIKDLEIRLGIEICSRGPSGFMLTSQGRVVYDISLLLAETLNICDERLEGLREDLSGVINIGVVSHILLSPKLRFDKIVKKTKEVAPNLTIECKVLTPREIINQIEKRQLHLGIMGAAEHPRELKFTPIFQEEAGLYCAEGHPLYLDDRHLFNRDALMGRAYVARAHNSITNIRAQALGLVAETNSNNIDVILSLILSGQYLGFLPVHAANSLRMDANIRRLPIAGPECNVTFYACTLKRVNQSRRTDTFLQILHDTL